MAELQPVPDRRERTPGIGAGSWLPRASLSKRLGVGLLIVVALAIAKVAVRYAEVQDPLGLLPAATEVAPGLLRGGNPMDSGLQLAQRLNVDGVVNVGGPSVSEQAAASFLDEAYMYESVGASKAPSAAQLEAVAHFLRRYTRGGKVVYLHDASDGGRAIVTADMLLLVRGWSWSVMTKTMAPGDWAQLDGSQLIALRDVDAALHAKHLSTENPYSALRPIPW